MKREILLSPACRAPQLWGWSGEKEHTRITVELPEDIAACNFYRAKITIKGKLFRTDYLEIHDGKVCFELTAAMVETSGIITAQIIGYVVDENGDIDEIGKTEIYRGNIKKSSSGKLTSSDSEPPLLDRIFAKLAVLIENMHSHKNQKLLDKFNIISDTDPFYGGADVNDLKYGGASLRFASEGAVVKRISEVEKDGEKFLRLHLNWGNEMQVEAYDDVVDIPVSAINKFTEQSGDVTFNVAQLDLGLNNGEVKSVTAFPETAAEGDVVLLHRCNEISVDDSHSGVLLDIPAIAALGVPDGYEQRMWEINAANSNGNGFALTLEIKRIDDYILTGLVIAAETLAGRWYWKDGEFTTDIEGGETELPPVNIPLGYVDGFAFTKTLYDLDYWEAADTDETVIFRTLPVHYMFLKGEWQLAKPSNDVTQKAIDELREAVEEINGGIDEIETLIDESGVLE